MNWVNPILIIALAFAVSIFESCSKKKNEDSAILIQASKIRQMTPQPTTESFLKNSTFHAARTPNIYFIFFDTLRPDFAAQHPNFKEFMDHNFTLNQNYSAGTATVYSTFSLFHSLPAFLAYKYIPTIDRKSDTNGSVFLKILKTLGYKTDIFGYYWGCIYTKVDPTALWDQFLTSFIGSNGSLLEHCSAGTQYDERFEKNQDEFTIEEVATKLHSTVTSPDRHFTMIALYNNHLPYRWGVLKHPPETDVGEKDDGKKKVQLVNRYKNSVAASDVNFKKLLDFLDTLPGHEDAIIVLFSDHGEMFFEKNDEAFHGGLPFKEKIRTVLSFKFSKTFQPKGKVSNDSLGAIADVFPTVFDYLGITPEFPSEMITGKSLLSSPRKSVLVIQSNKNDPTREMAAVNANHKVWLKVEGDDFYSARNFKYYGTTDLDDNPVPPTSGVCFQKSPEDCRKILEIEFPEAMHELFPESVRH